MKLAAELQIGTERYRFGPEGDAEDLLVSAQWTTQIPGGFHTGSFVITRPAWIGPAEEPLFGSVRFYDAEAGHTLYEGLVTAKPQVSADAISAECEGLAATLDYDVPFRENYSDRDLAHWQGPSRARRLALLPASTYRFFDHSVVPDHSSGIPALAMAIQPETNVGVLWICEAYYDAGPGLLIGEIQGEWARSSHGTSGLANSAWDWKILAADDDQLTGVVDNGDLQNEPSGTGTFATTINKRWVALRLFWTTGTNITEGREYELDWRDLQIIGDHGLTLYDAAGGGKGVLGSDVILDVLARNAPLIDVNSRNVETSSYVIPHLVFRGEDSARSVIEQVTLLGGAASVPNDWGVYDDGFFWREPGTYGRTWRIRRDQYADATKEGPSAAERYNAAYIIYTDGAGTQRSVGPDGSGADTESADLLDTNPSNPVNRAGIPRKTLVRQVGITDEDGAILIGRLLLQEASRADRKGSITVTGTAKTDEGHTYPAGMIRAGDEVVIEDDPDPAPLPINSTSYAHESMTLTANVGAVPDSLEVLLSQLDAAMVNL